MVSTARFRQEIRSRLETATTRGCQDLIIDSGELYKSLSQLPVFGPWMIFCCNAMRAEMRIADRLIFDDAGESLLTINYKLPRNSGLAGPKIKPAHRLQDWHRYGLESEHSNWLANFAELGERLNGWVLALLKSAKIAAS